MRLKSVNFTSIKVHNFHSLLLAPVYHVIMLHFSFARCPDITPPCHSNLYHFIQVLIISCLGTILASLYSQSPLHLYSLLLLPQLRHHLDCVPPLLRHLQWLKSGYLILSITVHPSLNPTAISTHSFHHLSTQLCFWPLQTMPSYLSMSTYQGCTYPSRTILRPLLIIPTH